MPSLCIYPNNTTISYTINWPDLVSWLVGYTNTVPLVVLKYSTIYNVVHQFLKTFCTTEWLHLDTPIFK